MSVCAREGVIWTAAYMCVCVCGNVCGLRGWDLCIFASLYACSICPLVCMGYNVIIVACCDSMKAGYACAVCVGIYLWVCLCVFVAVSMFLRACGVYIGRSALPLQKE